MTVLSVRDRQKYALQKMLNLNEEPSTTNVSVVLNAKANSTEDEPVWKLLIYDTNGQDIISPLLNVKELRECGVTLHLRLHSDRDAIPDVPAIYFVSPTDENIQRICSDLRSRLYDRFYFNFITPVSRDKLEQLAAAALQGNCAASVKKVYDQYLDFISLEQDMFILKEHQSHNIAYYAIHKGDVTEEEMNRTLDTVADGLFSLLATLNVVPIIRAAKGNAAEQVAHKLHKRLRDSLQNVRSSLFASSTDFSKNSTGRAPLSFQRPLLLILDRSIDMATPLHHTWTYQALVHDVMPLKLNQAKIVEPDDLTAGKRLSNAKVVDLGPEDKFWSSLKGSPFPQVAETVQEQLDAFRADEEQVTSLKNAMGAGGELGDVNDSLTESGGTSLNDTTARITSAVSSLPELLERKKLLDLHTSLASAVLEHIKKRKLDVYFELEEKLLSRGSNERPPLELLNDEAAGSPADKLRLLLILYLCAGLAPTEMGECEKALQNQGIPLHALQYLKRWKSVTNSVYNSTVAISNAAAISGGTRTVSMFSKLMSQGSQFVMEGVKNLVVKRHNLPVTRVVDSLMEQKGTPEADDYIYLDPKIGKQTARDDSNSTRIRTNFQEAIVFVVGGGNYIEYQNLVDYCKNKNVKGTPKQIIYGCTDLVNGDGFLRQLSQLGEEL